MNIRTDNHALVPRRQEPRWRIEEEREDEQIEEAAIGYAPPGANLRAQVRRLGDLLGLESVTPGEGDAERVKLADTSTEVARGDGLVVLRIDAEVVLERELIERGVVVETRTRVVRAGEGKE